MMFSDYDKRIDELIRKTKEFGYDRNDMWAIEYRLNKLREQEQMLFELSPYKVGDIVLLTGNFLNKNTGFESWRYQENEPVKIIGINTKDKQFLLTCIYLWDRWQESSTRYYRKTREKSVYCYSFYLQELKSCNIALVDPWSHCKCIEINYSWKQKKDNPCLEHPLTPYLE